MLAITTTVSLSVGLDGTSVNDLICCAEHKKPAKTKASRVRIDFIVILVLVSLFIDVLRYCFVGSAINLIVPLAYRVIL